MRSRSAGTRAECCCSSRSLLRMLRWVSVEGRQVELVEPDAEGDDDGQQIGLESRVQPEPVLQVAPAEQLDGLRVEVSLPADALGGKEIVDPLHPLAEQERAPRRVEGELLPVQDLR